jgi:RNA polymerase sigma-B factor
VIAARATRCSRGFLPLARKLAARYANAQEPLHDLVQVASVGLLGAIDRFDPGREIPLHGFAIPTILAELKRHFRDTGWSVHVPRGAKELALAAIPRSPNRSLTPSPPVIAIVRTPATNGATSPIA